MKVISTEENIVFSSLLQELYGAESIHDETYFAYDWGDGELVDDNGMMFFYHAEYDGDKLVVEKWNELEDGEPFVEKVTLSDTQRKDFIEVMNSLMERASFSFN